MSYMVRGATGLPRGSLLLIEHGKGVQIELWDGELWITQEGDSRDHVVGPGDLPHDLILVGDDVYGHSKARDKG